MSEIFNFNLTFLSLWEDFDVLTISCVTVSRVDTLDSSGSPVWRLDPVSVFSRVYVTSNPSARTAMEASRQSVSEASTLRRKQVRRVAWHSLNRNFACNLHSLAQRWEFSGSSATFSEFFCSQCDRRAPPTSTMKLQQHKLQTRNKLYWQLNIDEADVISRNSVTSWTVMGFTCEAICNCSLHVFPSYSGEMYCVALAHSLHPIFKQIRRLRSREGCYFLTFRFGKNICPKANGQRQNF